MAQSAVVLPGKYLRDMLSKLTKDGHERIVDRLACRFCRQFSVLYNSHRVQGILLHPADRAEPQGVCGV